MGLTDILLIGAGLAMDAAAVSMTNGMVYKNLNKLTYISMPVFFGVFQMLMPVMGYYAGGLFAEIMTLKILFFQAIATSIDAFAVGIGFSAVGIGIFRPSAIIGAVTVFIVVAAIFIGRRFGNMLGCRAEILGGMILAVIGIKALF